MNYKKYKTMIGAMAVSMMLVGCSGGTTETNTAAAGEENQGKNTFAYSDTSQEAPISKSIMGMVSSIEGNVITLSIGGFGGGMPGDGERPEMPEDGEMPEMPTDGEMPEMPGDGEMPETPADGKAPEMTEAVLTIGDESVILVQTANEDGKKSTESGTLANITKGSRLSIEFDADGLITSITVSTGRGGMGTLPEGGQDGETGGRQTEVESHEPD